MDHEDVDTEVKAVASDVIRLGYTRASFKSDNEPALVAFLRALRRHLAVENIQISPETSAEYDPSGNGSAECGVGISKGLVRTNYSDLVSHLGVHVPPEHSLLTWLVYYSGAMQRRFTVGADGRTPYERVHGRKCAQMMAYFGEKIWWLPLDPDNELPDPGSKFKEGWWVGPVEGQSESYVLTSDGHVRCRTFRRRPADQQ